ncbi:septum formation initiator family protein [uncultured Rikenella sp.]|uniref:FtsB family cell division protein n=1 Tax=uncultured Rikenella sp. TaxID=368003 RepID=UPI002628E820|nr:septum formation initiator family protein [uncultured Rikenella sp.]
MKIERLFSNRNIFICATLAFIAWIVFFDRNNYLDSRQLDRKIRELEQEKIFYIHKIAEDSAVIAGLKDSAFLERFARENFLMHRPGEVIYLIDEK